MKRIAICMAMVAILFAGAVHADESSSIEEQPKQLAEVLVEENSESGPPIGYVPKRAKSATKTDTLLIETPQSISVITQDRIRDQGAQSVQDALRYTAGIRGETYGLDSRGDWSTIRGSDPVIFHDGMQQTFGYYASSRPDPYTLESIEVLRGPSSVLYGQGTVGGIVNLTSKRPLEEQQGEIQFQYGTFDRRHVAADVTGKITEDGSLLYRMIAIGRESNTQVDYVDDDRFVFAPSLTWRPNNEVEWTLLGNYQNDQSGSTTQFLPHAGTVLPAPGGLPRIPIDVFMSEPGFDKYDTKQASVTSLFSYEAGKNLTFRQNLRYSDSEVHYNTIYPEFAPALQPTGDINRVFWVADPDLKYWTADNQVESRFETGAIRHTALGGVDFQYAKTKRTWAYGSAGSLNLYKPQYGNFTPPTADMFQRDPDNTIEQYGLYLQDQAKVYGNWIVVAGVRSDWARNKVEDSGAQQDHALTSRAALMYKSEVGIAPYVSYSESFLPQIGMNVGGETYDPLEGNQWETGIKFQPEGMNSFVTLAAYNLEDKNRLTPDPLNPQNQLQTGRTRARGIELEGMAELTSGLSLIGSYSYTDTRVLEGTPDYDDGKHLPSVPQNMASLWAEQRFAFDSIPGTFRAGAGVRYVGDSWDGTDSLKTPGTTLVDAMVGYDVNSWSFAINANNLEDETYYTTCLARGDCFIGARRTVVGTVSYHF